ncbi:hypothetical protein F5Y18DRAFT_428853 [Xylariaceae sp. FL1019]|nr:hypothetical protein F5Y18DRAFT_428853 [Xylariaceae sp. FL1019]
MHWKIHLSPVINMNTEQAALERLGYTPCLHNAHILPHADRTEFVFNAMREQDPARRQKMVAELTAGHAAAADLPAIVFLPELMVLYPDAVVVLNLRENGKI